MINLFCSYIIICIFALYNTNKLIMENLKILQAILLMAETLKYSSTYKEYLIKEIKEMINNEIKNN